MVNNSFHSLPEYQVISKNISQIQQMMHRANLTAEMRNMLEDKYLDYQAKIASLQDRIKNNLKDTLSLQKQVALQQAENEKRSKLARFERENFSGQTYKEWKHDQDLKIKEMEKELKKKKEINKLEKLQNDQLKAKLALDKALDDKTTRILKRQQDGSWQWEFSQDPEKVATAEKKLKEANEKLAEADIQARIDSAKSYRDERIESWTELEYQVNRIYDKQKNSIEKYFSDTDSLVQNGCKQLTDKFGSGIYKMIEITQKKLKEIQQIAAREKINSYNNAGIGFDAKYVVPVKYDTGGQTSNDGLAFVHKKEMVLSQDQTASFEKLVNILPKMADLFSLNNFNTSIPAITAPTGKSNTVIENITANFPNATEKNEIQAALLELPRLALQVV